MAEKTLNSRIILKHDIEVNWSNSTNFIPKIGEIIVYDPDENHAAARVKIGDGVKTVIELAFIDDAAKEALFKEIDMVDDKVEALGQLVGNTSVPEQIQAAIDELHVVAKTGSWNDLEDRPLTTETITITYDGKTEGYVVADTGTNGAETSMTFYKVSDLVLTKENIIGQTVTAFNTGNINSTVITENFIAEYEQGVIIEEAIALVYNDNVTIDSYLFPEKGVYFFNLGSGMYYISSLTAAITVFDEKLIPYTIARRKDIKQADWAECDGSSASYVKNRTHYYREGATLCEKISFNVTSESFTRIDQLINFEEGKKYKVVIDDVSDICTAVRINKDSENYIELTPTIEGFGAVRTRLSGMICTYISGVSVGDHTLSIYEDNELKQLDEKFIPDIIARKSDLAQPDWNENDKESLAYIKNRPFNDSVLGEKIFDLETAGEPEQQIDNDDTHMRAYNMSVVIKDQSKYLIIFNGKEYVATGKIVNSDGGIAEIRVPSKDIGEYVDLCFQSNGSTVCVIVMPRSGSGEYSLIIYEYSVELKQLDEKFIPESIRSNWNESDSRRLSYIENKTHYFYEGNPILENHSITITDENSNNETQLDVVVNLVKRKKYRILINGELITISEAAPGMGKWFGSICIFKNNIGGAIGKSFCLRTTIDRETGEYTTTYIEGLPAGTYSLSIYEDSDFKQLDEMFIPTFTVEDIDALCSGYVAAEEMLF